MSSSVGIPRQHQAQPEGAPVQSTTTEATWSRWTCVLCNTIMNSKNISSHLHGGNHTKKLDQARKLASDRSNDAPTPDGWRCQLCERSFPADDIESHLRSVEHGQKAISHVPLSRKNKKRRAAAETGQEDPAGPSDDARRDGAAEQTQATQAAVGRGRSHWHGARRGRGGAGRGRRGRGGGGDGEAGNVETGFEADSSGQGVDNATDVGIDGASAGGGGEGAAPRSRGRGRGGRRGRGRGGGRGGGGGGGDDGSDSPGEGGSGPSHGRGRGGPRSGRGTGRASSSATEVEYTHAELLELYYEARSGFGVLHGFEASGYTSD